MFLKANTAGFFCFLGAGIVSFAPRAGPFQSKEGGATPELYTSTAQLFLSNTWSFSLSPCSGRSKLTAVMRCEGTGS